MFTAITLYPSFILMFPIIIWYLGVFIFALELNYFKNRSPSDILEPVNTTALYGTKIWSFPCLFWDYLQLKQIDWLLGLESPIMIPFTFKVSTIKSTPKPLSLLIYINDLVFVVNNSYKRNPSLGLYYVIFSDFKKFPVIVGLNID